MGRPRVSMEERFWQKVQKTDGCWLWRGQLLPNGYGRLKLTDQTHGVGAHRYSYELANGPVPPGLHVCHRCDVRHCVRPDHLFAGTDKDNSDDKVAKGRQAKGEMAGNAVLTERDVRAILYLHEACGVEMQDLSRAFAYNSGAIHQIICGNLWKHIERTE